MKKIETSVQTLLEDVGRFYNDQTWHFITVNCVEVADGFEMQYFFAKYGVVEESVCFFLLLGYEETVPSIVPLITSAYLGEGEMVDMFGVNIEGVSRGTFLEEDSIQTPLRRGS